MDSNIQLRRLEAAKLAYAINKIEGVPVSDSARKLYARWARGEITGKEMKDALISAHRKGHGVSCLNPQSFCRCQQND